MEYLSIIFLAIGFTLGCFLFSKPRLALWSLLISVMVLTGMIWYFYPTFARIQWVNVMIIAVLFFRILFVYLQEKNRPRGFPPIIFPIMVLFIGLSITTSLANFYLQESFIAAKNYFQFWLIPFVLYCGDNKENDMSSYMKAFIYIALLMPFIALFQFYIMGSGHDTVTGTFGSTYSAAGGPNAALSIFIVSQIAVLLLMAEEKLLPWLIVIILTAWAFITLALTIAQAIIGFILITLLFLFGKDLIRLSFRSVIAVSIALPFLLLLFSVYFTTVSHKIKMEGNKAPKSYTEYINRAVNLNLGTETDKLNRTNIILLWWNYNTKKGSIAQMFFGYGLGSVKYGGLEKGHIQKKFGETKIGFTALANLLWDVGLIGTFLYICIYFSGFILAGKLKKDDLPKIHKVFMTSAQLSCLFFILSIPYKLSIIGNQAFNFYSFFILGYICFWQRRLRFTASGIEMNLSSNKPSRNGKNIIGNKSLETVR